MTGQSQLERPTRDLADRADIEVVVRTFYQRVYADPLLGPVFIDVAKLDLQRHLPVMYDFWETVLFRAGRYRRNALQAHVELHAKCPLTPEHFGRWLALWTRTVDEHFRGDKAELAKTQASRVGYSISRRLMGESGSEFVTIPPRGRRPASKAEDDPLK